MKVPRHYSDAQGIVIVGFHNGEVLGFPVQVLYPAKRKAADACAEFANHAAEQPGAPDGDGRRTERRADGRTETADGRPASATSVPDKPGRGERDGERTGPRQSGEPASRRCQPGQTQHTGPHTKAEFTLMAADAKTLQRPT